MTPLLPLGSILKPFSNELIYNVEKCEIGEREWDDRGDPTGALESVSTPDCKTIEDVRAYFKKNLIVHLRHSYLTF